MIFLNQLIKEFVFQLLKVNNNVQIASTLKMQLFKTGIYCRSFLR